MYPSQSAALNEVKNALKRCSRCMDPVSSCIADLSIEREFTHCAWRRELVAGLIMWVIALVSCCGGLGATEGALFQPTGLSGKLTAGFYGENEEGPILVIEKEESVSRASFFTWSSTDGLLPLPAFPSSVRLKGISPDARFLWFDDSLQPIIYDRDSLEAVLIGPLIAPDGLTSVGSVRLSAIQGYYVAGIARFDIPQPGNLPKVVHRYFIHNLVRANTQFMTEETPFGSSTHKILGLKEDGSQIVAAMGTSGVAILHPNQATTVLSSGVYWNSNSPHNTSPNAKWVSTHDISSGAAYRAPITDATAVQSLLSKPRPGPVPYLDTPTIRVLALHDSGRAYGWVLGKEDAAGHSGGACVWQPNNCRVMIQETLTDFYSMPLVSWRLTEAFGGDAAGLRLAGFGTNPDGQTEAWLVTLPHQLISPDPAPEICMGTGATTYFIPSVTSPSDASRVSLSINHPPTLIGAQHLTNFFVANNGSADLIVDQIEIIGPDAAEFSLRSARFSSTSWNLPQVIRPANEFLSAVQFSPASSGRKHALMRVHTNDPNKPIFEVTLSGLGPAPIPEITLLSGSIYGGGVIAEGATAHMGAATIQRSLSRSFNLKNIGNAPLLVRKLTVSNSDHFTVVSIPTSAVAPNQTAAFSVSLSPDTLDTVETELHLEIDHPDVSSWQARLTGNGRSPLSCLATTLTNETLPSGSDLPPMGHVTTTDLRRLAVARIHYNDQDPQSPATLGFRVWLEGGDISDFQVGFGSSLIGTLPSTVSINRNQAAQFQVVFAPKTPGSKQAWVVVDDSGERIGAPLRFRVTGESVATGAPVFRQYPGSSLRRTGPIPVVATGSTSYTLKIWRDGTASTFGTVGSAFQIAPSEFYGRFGRYRLELVNASGSVMGPEFWIGWVPSTSVINPLPLGKTGVLTSGSKGPEIIHQWSLNGVPLTESAKHSGTNKATLRIAAVDQSDAGEYTCQITMNSPDGQFSEIEGGQQVSVFPAPQIVPFSLRPTRVSEFHEFAIDSLPRNRDVVYRFSGLPPGMVGDDVGQVFGRISPTAKPGIYRVKVTARNAAGQSPPFVVNWLVEPFDRSVSGTYQCLFNRESMDIGGRAIIRVSNTGSFSSRVCREGRWRTVRGILIGTGPSALPPRHSYDPPLPGGMTMPDGETLGIGLFGFFEGYPLWFFFGIEDGVVAGGVDLDLSSIQFNGVKAIAAPEHLFPPSKGLSTHHLHVAPPEASASAQDPPRPAGHGFARMTLARSGAVRWAGRLGDSRSFSGSSSGGWQNSQNLWMFPLHHAFYNSRGVFQGWLTAVTNNPITFAGEMDWHKEVVQPRAGDRNYPRGFTALKVPASASQFLIPLTTDLLPGWPKPASPVPTSFTLDSDAWPEPSSETWTTTLSASGQHQWHSVDDAPWRFLRGQLTSRTGRYSGIGVRTSTAPTPSASAIPRSATFEGLWIPHLEAILGHNKITIQPNDDSSNMSRPPFSVGPILIHKNP